MRTEKSVVITGASTGIGRACALHMDSVGWRVFAGVRRDPDAEPLRAEASPRLTPLRVDVSSTRSVAAARKFVEEATGEAGLDGLVNNAGVPYGGPVEFLDLDEVRKAFEVNFFGVISVTQAFLPLLRRRRGRIVNMSSVSGRVASPFLSPYSTSKFALEALSDALRVELRHWGIRVSVIEPGAIDTPIWDKGGRIVRSLVDQAAPQALEQYAAALAQVQRDIRPHGIPARHVAHAVEHALTSSRPRTRYPIGLDGHLAEIFRHLPDGIRDSYFRARLPE